METAPAAHREGRGDNVFELKEYGQERKRLRRLARLHASLVVDCPSEKSSTPPFSARRAVQEAIKSLQVWIFEHPSHDLMVSTLAPYAGLSKRHFMRVFRRNAGMPPGEFVDKVRVDAAILLLVNTDLLQQQMAVRCGFANADVMRPAFMRIIGKSPRAYRADFLTGAVSEAAAPKTPGRAATIARRL